MNNDNDVVILLFRPHIFLQAVKHIAGQLYDGALFKCLFYST